MLNTAINIVFDGVAYAMMLFVISVGLSVTMGMMGFVNLAHGAFAMAGGYATVSLMNGLGMPFFAALPVGAVGIGLASIPLERLLYARLYRASELDQVMLCIGLIFMAAAATVYVYGPSPQAIRLPAWLRGGIDAGIGNFPAYRSFTVIVGFALFAALYAVFEGTLIGARVRAAVDNRRMAESVGINVGRMFTAIFAAGSALAALGGGLAIEIVGLDPTFAIRYMVFFLIVVAVGGLGSITGAFVAALVLGLVDNAAKYVFPAGGGFFIYAATVALLLWKPAGLFGRR